jgi:hypothetical protein
LLKADGLKHESESLNFRMNRKDLTKQDLLILLEIIDDAFNCQDMDSYKQLVLKMQLLINFESAFCIKFNLHDLLAKKNAGLSFTIIRYPEEYLERYIAKSYNLVDPVVKEYLPLTLSSGKS